MFVALVSAAAWIVGSAGVALAVAEVEELEALEVPALEEPVPANADTPPVGTEPAPRVMPRSVEEPQPRVERQSQPDPAAATESLEAAAGSVARSAFTREVLDREPQGEVSALENDATEIAYFTELRGLDGHLVTHRWELNGESMAEVAFEVRGERWRVHSKKTLDPSWLGTWSVVVVDATGAELSRETFDYVAVGQAPGDAAAPPAAPAPPTAAMTP
jgi:hypothetical protein